MQKLLVILLSIIIMAQSCRQQFVPKDSKYPSMVGDIEHDPTLDDPNFTLCDEKNTKQYHNLNYDMQYEGEKYAINKTFLAQLNH